MAIPSRHSQPRFTDSLLLANGLDRTEFLQWIFKPAMLFHARRKWWGGEGKRELPHEGLDLCLYRSTTGSIHCLPAGTEIPAMVDGIIVRILDDYLGKSLFIEQTPLPGDNARFFFFYGHSVPLNNLRVGQPVKQGDRIAVIADIPPEKSSIIPHVHISLGWAPHPVDQDRLDWRTIGEGSIITLINPVDFLDWDYEIIDEPLVVQERKRT